MAKINKYQEEFVDSGILEILEEARLQTAEQIKNNKKVILNPELKLALNGLKDQEKEIITLRYGLNTGKKMTLTEIGKIFHVTKERIRQIEVKALRKLVNPSKSEKIDKFKEQPTAIPEPKDDKPKNIRPEAVVIIYKKKRSKKPLIPLFVAIGSIVGLIAYKKRK